MKTQTDQPGPPIDLPAQAYRHLIHTLVPLLPPPVTDTPEATLARNHAAIARIAALAPVNANEAELAAQCIAARAQAEDVLRLTRLHADDIRLVIRLNAQYATMVRTSLAAHSHLMREQQQRRKREATHEAADNEEWSSHIAANTMLQALPTAPQAYAASQAYAATPTQAASPARAAPTAALKPSATSHAMDNETPMRQSPSHLDQIIDLCPSPPQTLDQDWQQKQGWQLDQVWQQDQSWQDAPDDEDEVVPDRQRLTH